MYQNVARQNVALLERRATKRRVSKRRATKTSPSKNVVRIPEKIAKFMHKTSGKHPEQSGNNPEIYFQQKF
jgi:hypothetical protein